MEAASLPWGVSAMDERFVGRSTELTFLRERLDEVRRGAPRVAALEDTAEIGKTALLRELLAGLGHDWVLRASGEELEARLDYGSAPTDWRTFSHDI
jgi:hypothetical protein